VRTGTISSNRLISFAKDCLIYFEHFSFEYHSVISEGLRKKLLFPPSSFILPLGAEELDIEPSFTDTDTLNLIYIGTLRFRNIDKTIIGLKKFMDDHPNVSVNYLIIADINAPEYSGIQSLIKAHHLETSIKMNGYVSHDKLADYLKISNIGVCFIPVLPQYDHQPATKAFEYLLAGIPTIATATSSNKQVINDTNGVLIQDSPESFAWGIEQIWRNIHQYDSISIKQSVSRYTWENIVSALEVQMEKMINEYQKNDLKTFENDFVH
jgi:glycosyltransferase involved in cell wall biosynthesis